MPSENAADQFLHLLCHCIRANPTTFVRVADHDRVPAHRLLLGYYDEDYVYIRPEIFIPVFQFAVCGEIKVNIRKIMEQLFAMDLIKVHWIMTGECRYRPQKRIGRTRKRYITFDRRKLNKYFRSMHHKEAV